MGASASISNAPSTTINTNLEQVSSRSSKSSENVINAEYNVENKKNSNILEHLNLDPILVSQALNIFSKHIRAYRCKSDDKIIFVLDQNIEDIECITDPENWDEMKFSSFQNDYLKFINGKIDESSASKASNLVLSSPTFSTKSKVNKIEHVENRIHKITAKDIVPLQYLPIPSKAIISKKKLNIRKEITPEKKSKENDRACEFQTHIVRCRWCNKKFSSGTEQVWHQTICEASIGIQINFDSVHKNICSVSF
jgi:hypothetical protein